jgi:hypothetical protein
MWLPKQFQQSVAVKNHNTVQILVAPFDECVSGTVNENLQRQNLVQWQRWATSADFGAVLHI